MQVLTCVKSPVQFNPAKDEFCELNPDSSIDGDGCVHVRERVCSPVPQDFVHADHEDQGENPPSTKQIFSMIFRELILENKILLIQRVIIANKPP